MTDLILAFRNAKNVVYKVNDLPYDPRIKAVKNLRFVIHNKPRNERWKDFDRSRRMLQEDIFGYDEHLAAKTVLEKKIDLNAIAEEIFDNYDLYHIMERNYVIQDLSLSNTDVLVFRQIVQSCHFLLSHDIDLYVINDNPHEQEEYVLTRCAEALGIPVVITRRSIVPWRAKVETGFGRRSAHKLLKLSQHGPENQVELDHYVDSLKGDHTKAFNKWIKANQDKYKKSYWIWKKELYKLYKRRFNKDHWRNTKAKYHALKAYEKWQTAADLDQFEYVTYFLHFQPERTTCPEGGIYNQQINAIKTLRALLPDHIKVVVKEHTSTYSFKFKRFFRFKDYYQSIAEIEGVYLVPMEYDPFILIDKSLAMATITGTSGMEAILRGKPTLYFGNAPFKDCPGSYYISDVLNQPGLLEEMLDKERANKSEAAAAYMSSWLDYSYAEEFDKDDIQNLQLFSRNAVALFIHLMTKTDELEALNKA